MLRRHNGSLLDNRPLRRIPQVSMDKCMYMDPYTIPKKTRGIISPKECFGPKDEVTLFSPNYFQFRS